MACRWIAALAAAAASCDGARATTDAAPPPDGRALGVIDGRCEGEPGRPRVLVYSYENLWRHLSNYHARLAVLGMCASRGFTVSSTNDPRAINATRLAEHDVIVFAVTSGSGLDGAARADLEAWIRGGGGVVGLEAAAATEQDWPFFVAHLGAAFRGHPPGLQRATVRVAAGHPITDGLPASFEHTEQWYVFQDRPEDTPGLEVLMTLDEATLPADFPDDFAIGYHAIAWALERDGGRVFYTALGDNPDAFAEPTIVESIGRGIEWTARAR